MFAFGPGVLIGTRTDIVNATPINIGKAQEFQLNLQFNKKELYGQNQFPLAIARGTAKMTGKAKAAQVSGYALNSLFFGTTVNPATGQIAMQYAEAATIPGTPYTYTVANGANFVSDLGVTYQSNGLPLTKVASAPAAGQYSVSTSGVYTFAAADTTKGVYVSYSYNITGAGQQIIVANQLIGTTPFFQLNYFTTFNGMPFNLILYQCMSEKLSLQAKLEDFVLPEIDFDILANAAGQVTNFSFAEVS